MHEFPEGDPGPSSKGRLVGDRIGRLESIIQQLAEQVDGHLPSSSLPSTPASMRIGVSSSVTHSKHQALSQTLLAAYPSHSDLRIIGSTGETLAIYLAHEYMTPFHRLEREVAVESERLWGKQQRQPQNTAETRPVLIARQMLMLACVLHHLHVAGSAMRSRKGSYRQLNNLSRPPRALARQLAEAVTTLVTAHDRFTSGTLDGLECLWLEAMYHEHNGNIRRSWLTCRRAISAAQLMGFPGHGRSRMPQPRSILQKQDGEALDLQQLWLCLVHNELALCLALGMQPSAFCPNDTFLSVANSATTEDDATHTSKLERRHAAISRRVIQRSERDPGFEDLDAALQIHTELEDAAAAIPSAWWIMPSLPEHTRDEADTEKPLFGTVMKLRAQILHAYLLLLAHLPAMLQAIFSRPTITTTPDRQNHHPDHNRDRDRDRNHLLASNRSICIEASRDLLRRFIHLRSCERTAGCFRLLDHYAWLAAATLLLARLLDGCQMMTTTTLLGVPEHQQHLSDRAMASEAIDRMRLWGGDEQEDGGDGDMYCYYSAGASTEGRERDVLARLLALEAGEDAVVVTYRKPAARFLGTSSRAPVHEGQDTLVLPFSFVGHVSIIPQTQQGSSVSVARSLLSVTMGCFPVTLDNKAGPHGFECNVEKEEEEVKDEEANFMRAMKQRRSAKWPSALYMCMLRPVS
ncbi:hypothetical protein SLS64_009218 [Diaporthe eres]|uniref:Transcription factor domain-containing protein n=1 Tax=Diaporthe eres TaxID=83184 RepID=A0ABR1NWC6_DIAER